MTRVNYLLVLMLILLSLFIGGCAAEQVPAPKTTADATAEQLKLIENNPNMPQDQKNALKARLEQQKQAGQATTDAAKGTKK